jgi:hypothetical protein
MRRVKQEWQRRKNYPPAEQGKRQAKAMKTRNGMKRFGSRLVPLILDFYAAENWLRLPVNNFFKKHLRRLRWIG